MRKSILIIASLVTGLFLASCSSSAPAETAETTKTEDHDHEDHDHEEMAKKEEMAPKVIKLEQTEGAFTTESLELEAGQEYSFEVTNNAGRKAALLVVPADKVTEGATVQDLMAASIPDAQLGAVLEDGQSGTTKAPVKLEAGEYVYFCPMNETPKYSITVK